MGPIPRPLRRPGRRLLQHAFGLPEHDNDQQVLNSQIPANAAIEIENPRGDVSVTAGDGSTIEVQAHEVAYASSDSEANKIFDAEAPSVKVSGNAVLVKSESNNSGRVNLTVTVPKSARVTVNAGKGDVTAAGLGAGINVSAHGDVHLSAITGSVQMHSSNGKHDFSAHQVDGDLTVDGDCNDLTLSEIKGKITQNGEILGDVHLENVSGSVHLHTTVTDLELAQLPGDMTLNSDDLRIAEAKGPGACRHARQGHRPEPDIRRQLRGKPRRPHLRGAGRKLRRGSEEQQGRRGGDSAAQRLGHGECPYAQRRHLPFCTLGCQCANRARSSCAAQCASLEAVETRSSATHYAVTNSQIRRQKKAGADGNLPSAPVPFSLVSVVCSTRGGKFLA
jgi:hypothetical protein